MKRLTLILTLLIPFFTFSQIINIPNDYPTIQQGIDAASNGDTVLVDTGTYYENINYMGNAITVASNYLISPDSSFIYNTIIDGSQPSHHDSASVVMFLSGEDTTSVLCGFTITKGKGFLYPSVYSRGGGGIVGMASGAKIINNIIISNSLENENGAGGGGISFYGGTSDTWVIINDNIIKSNEVSDPVSAFGGGIYVSINSLIERNIIEYNACNSTIGYAEAGGIEFQDIFSDGFQFILKNNIIQNNILDGEYARGGGIAYFSGISKSKFTNKTQHNPPTLFSIITENIISYNEINANLYHWGAGIYIGRPVTNINITSNDISFNSSVKNEYSYGGGLFMAYSENHKVHICNNKVESNTAVEGGGFFIQNAYNLQIDNNLFYANAAYEYGGVIRMFQYNGKENYTEKIVHVTENNRQESDYKRDNELIYSNNTFVDNTAETGGAIYINNEPYNPIICNSIFWGNTTPSGNGKDITITTSSTATLNNNNIDPEYIEGAWDGNGNIFDNPKFVGSGNHPYQINDYSPCIDVGTSDTTGLNLPEYDLAGNLRIYYEIVDMGAYEWNPTVGIVDASMPETSNSQVSTYPNPFSTSTTIEYQLNQPSDITIHIYNHLGELVEVIEQHQQQGKQQVAWNAEGLTAGIYYFRLQAGEQVASGKVVLVR